MSNNNNAASAPRTYADKPIYPVIDPVDDDNYVLRQHFTYVWVHGARFYRITVPAGLVYDGASVPNYLGWIVDIHPDGQNRTAALVHDWLYIFKGNLPAGSVEIWKNGRWEKFGKTWTRKAADKLFCRILRESGVSRFKRRLSFRAVRSGGWIYWNRHNHKDQETARRVWRNFMAVMLCFFLGGCPSATLHRQIDDAGGRLSDKFLADQVEKLCDWPSIGSVKRRYAADQEKYREYHDFCDHDSPHTQGE